MRSRAPIALVSLVAICTLALAQEGGAPPVSPRVLSLRRISANGGRVDWFKGDQHELIAYDAITDPATHNTDLFTMQPDGSQPRNLTGSAGLRKGYLGQPAWHPDGEHIVFQVENANSPHRLFNNPMWGFDNDLWLIKRDGSGAECIWETSPNGAALHPHFNATGTQLVFAERVATGRKVTGALAAFAPGGENQWEGWRIHLADFDLGKPGKQKLSHHRTLFAETRGFYETHGFLQNGDLVYSHTAEGAPYVDDVYRAHPDGKDPVNLTGSPATWDEHGCYSPDERLLAFMSSRADRTWQAPRSTSRTLRTELFVKTPTGPVEQLTALNQETPAGLRSIISDFDWDRAGRRIVFLRTTLRDLAFESVEIWLLTLKPE